MNYYKKVLFLAASILLAMMLVQSTQAAPTAVGKVVLVNFYHLSTGGNWNRITYENRNKTVASLIDFNTGLPTTVSYTGSNINGGLSTGSIWSANKAWVSETAADGGFSVGNRIITITFGGLTGSSYTVELVAAGGSSSPGTSAVGDYMIGGSFADRNFNGTAGVNGDDFDTIVDGTTLSNWLIWDNVAPVSNNIVITIDTTQSGGVVYANAVRLREISVGTDPATMGKNSTPASSGGLSIANNTFRQDRDDVIDFFHNNATGNVTTDLGGTSVVQRWARTWECDVTDVGDNGGTVDLTFDFVAAGMNGSHPPAGAVSNYKLLHRVGTSGDFSVLTTGTPVVNTAGWTVTFPDVDVQTAPLCSQITLGTLVVEDSPTAVSLQSISANSNTVILPLLVATLLLALMGGVALRWHSR